MSSALSAQSDILSSPKNFFIGSYDSWLYFSGSIDEVRLYNRTLTEDEIKALYHEGGWPLE